MASEQGYSNQKKKGKAQFKTIHSVNNDAFGTSNIPKYLFDIDPADKPIVSIADVIGKDGQVEFWNLEITAHLASVGSIIRLVDGAFKNFEFEVMSVPDANHVYVLPISSSKPAIADNVRVMGWVTARADDEGNPISSQGPVKFVLDGVDTEVEEDTLVPANNRPLPVKLTGFTGDITVTANQLDVSLDNINDSVALGDGSGNLIDTLSTTSGYFAVAVKDEDTQLKLEQVKTALIDGVIDPNNSSTIPLGAGGVFTGLPFEVTEYAAINVTVASDVASATDGVKVQFSPDAVNWDHSHATTYSGGSGVGYIFNAEFKYARVVYTNDGSAQGYFRLQTIFKKSAVKQSLYTIAQSVTDNMFAELGKNVIIGKTTGGGGGYVAVKVNPSGTMAVEDGTVNTTLATTNSTLSSLLTELQLKADVTEIQPVSATSWPLPTGAATETTLAKLPKALVNVEHDQVVNTYVGATNRLDTVVYKLLGATVATLTFTYDGSNRLVDVTRT